MNAIVMVSFGINMIERRVYIHTRVGEICSDARLFIIRPSVIVIYC